jgi:tetratricopeptide (TPR) repeat protein
MRPLLYNPALVPAKQRIAQFVVRHDELEHILRVLHGNTGPAHEHLLVLGGRGLGKSTLVQRVVAEIEGSELAQQWYPLVFPEESYEVAHLGEFWLEALHRLADHSGDPRWRALHQQLWDEPDPARLAHRARQALRSFVEERGGHLLLVVENLDMLLEQLPEPDAWALRETLQTDPTFMLLATALRPFDGITDHGKPFYEGFRRIELQPLTAPQIERLWRQGTNAPLDLPRARAIRVLTGGNPRMVVLLAQLAQGHTLEHVLEDLTQLIDAHTGYFKSHIEALDGHNRRVFLALASLWSPATAGEVARQARLDSNVVSTILGRLERQGRIEVVGKKGKNRQYQVAERLYNIYYLLRRQGGADARLQALLDFMVLFYRPDDLALLVQRLLAEGRATGDEHGARMGGGLLRAHRQDSEARAAILQSLPPSWLAHVAPREIRLSKRRPEEMLALLQRPDGGQFLPDASRLLEKQMDQTSPALRALAEHLVRSPEPELATVGALWWWLHEPQALGEHFDAAEGNALVIGQVGGVAALLSGTTEDLQAWRERLARDRDAFLVLQGALQLCLHPADAEAARAAFSDLAFLGPHVLERCLQALLPSRPQATLEHLASALCQPDPEPWALAAQVEVELALGRPDRAAAAADRLLKTHAAAEQTELFAALVWLERGELERAQQHLSRAIAAQPTHQALGLQAEIELAQGRTEEGGARLLALLRDHPLCPACGPLLARYAPQQALSLWEASPPHSPTEHLALLVAATGATDRRLWQAAVRHVSVEPLSPSCSVLLARLQGLLGRPDLAWETFRELAQKGVRSRARDEALMGLAFPLAASGQGVATARVLAEDPGARQFRPLIAALAPELLPEPALSAEERAMAEDVTARVRTLQQDPDLWKGELPLPLHRAFPSLSTLVPATEPARSAKPRTRRTRSAKAS